MKVKPRGQTLDPSVVEAMMGRASENSEPTQPEKVPPINKEAPKPKAETKPSKPKYETDRVYEIASHKIKPWAYDERDFESLGYSDDIESLLQDIRAYGKNQQPILVRPLKKPEGGFEFEEVYGRRRLHCCQLLHFKIRTFVREMSDDEAFVEQEIENTHRKDVSTWAKAKSYQRALEQGLYKTARELAVRANVTESMVSQYVSIYKNMPEMLIEADEKINWGFLSINTKGSLQRLIEKCEEDEGFCEYLCQEIYGYSILLKKEANKEKGIGALWKRYQAKNGINKTDSEKGKLFKATVVSKENQKMFSIKEAKNGTVTVNIMKEMKERYTPEEIMKLIQNAFEKGAKNT